MLGHSYGLCYMTASLQGFHIVMMVSTKEMETWLTVALSVLHTFAQLNCDELSCIQVKVFKKLWSSGLMT